VAIEMFLKDVYFTAGHLSIRNKITVILSFVQLYIGRPKTFLCILQCDGAEEVLPFRVGEMCCN